MTEIIIQGDPPIKIFAEQSGDIYKDLAYYISLCLNPPEDKNILKEKTNATST